MAEYSIGYNFKNQIIYLPDKWKVNTFKTVKPKISKKEIKNAIINPINSKRICDLVKKVIRHQLSLKILLVEHL